MIENGSFLLSKAQVQPTDIPGFLAQTGTLSPSLIAAFMWSLEVKSEEKSSQEPNRQTFWTSKGCW